MKNGYNIYNEVGDSVKVGNVIQRYFIYFFTILAFVLLIILVALTGELQNIFDALAIPKNIFIEWMVVLLPIFFVIFLWERWILNYRKKLGLPLYKDIKEELKEIAVNQRIDKGDLGYWHGLLESGAITKEEYEVKKKELL